MNDASSDENRDPYLLGLTAAFWLLTGGVLWKLRRADVEPHITPFNLLMIGLAAYRSGRVLALDEVTQPLREPFVRVEGEGKERREHRLYGGVRGAMSGLVTCPDCSGFWAAGLFSYALLLFPRLARVVLLALAASGLGQLFNASVEVAEKVAKNRSSDS